jgi:hypothetical protein
VPESLLAITLVFWSSNSVEYPCVLPPPKMVFPNQPT